MGALKWAYYLRSENPPTMFHGREGHEDTLFSRMIRTVLVRGAQILLLKQLSGSCPLRARAGTRRYGDRTSSPDNNGMLETCINRG